MTVGLLGLLSTEAGFSYTDGAPILGLPVVGLLLGFPGSTVGTTVVGAAGLGFALEGWALGLPGGTVGPPVVGGATVGG